MAHIDDVKRYLLRGAVQENVERRWGSPLPPFRPRRRAWRIWLRSMLLVGLPLILLTSSDISSIIPAGHAAFASFATLVSRVVRRGLSSLLPSQNGALDSPFPAPVPFDLRVLPLGVTKIAIDPGHGGADSGATTPLGIVEKDVTLDIGLRLRRLLEDASFEVVMTRERDKTVSLARRAKLANTKFADLFVSIHVNWFKTPDPRGAETYYLGPTDDPHSLELAVIENRISGYSLGDYRRLLESIYLDVRRTESHQLAKAIQHELATSLRPANSPLVNRGVKMAPFLVLVATEMPAILSEVSYLSNQEEARSLATPEYRQRVAQALMQGILAYANTLNLSSQKGS